MGLFNSGKNEKVEKVSKYERHYNVPQNSSRRRSSKHRSHQGEASARAMSQPPLMRMGGGTIAPGGFYPASAAVFNPPVVGTAMTPNVMPQVRYPIPQFDLSKYTSPTAFQANPFTGGGGQVGAMNLAPIWNNGIGLVNNRSAFQQPLNDYQQVGWPGMSQGNYGYMQPMQF